MKRIFAAVILSSAALAAWAAPYAPRLLIRLDGGAGLALVHYGPESFRPGQRVQVVLSPGGPRAEATGLEP